MAIKTPLPLGISKDLPGGGYGFFLDLHNVKCGHTDDSYFVVGGALGGKSGRKGGGRRKDGKRDSQGIGETGEKEKNCATSRNILQSKKCKEAGANKYRGKRD